MSSSMSGYGGPGGGNKIPKGYQTGQIQRFTPEMMQLFKSLFSQVGPESYTSRLAGGDEELFDEMEAPALRQFNEMQGGLASRFSGMGGAKSLSSRNSSGFQNASNSAAADFAQQLQSQRQELQRNAIKDLMGMSTNLLQQQPYDQYLVEKPQKQNKSSGWGSAIGAGLGGLGGFFAGGGPAGALKGAQLGYGIGSSF